MARRTIVGHVRLVPANRKEQRERLGAVHVVIDDEYFHAVETFSRAAEVASRGKLTRPTAGRLSNSDPPFTFTSENPGFPKWHGSWKKAGTPP